MVFFDGVISLIYLLIQLETTDILNKITANYEGDIWVPGILAGLAQALGVMFACYSVSKGLAGPALAIIN